MQDSFDPHREWLDIEDAGRPPNHYILLGIKPSENDPQVVARAADVRMAKVRKIRPGGHLAEWGRLLDQLAAAKVCLLDPASKAAYDASLPAQTPAQPAAAEASASATASPAPVAAPPTPADPSQSPPGSQVSSMGVTPQALPQPPPPWGTTPQGWAAAPSPLGRPAETSYDSAAQAGGQPQPPTQPPVHVPVARPSEVVPSTGIPAGQTSQPTTAAKKSANPLLIGVLAILIVGLVVAFYYVLNRDPGRLAGQESQADQSEPESPPASRHGTQSPEPSQPPDDTSRSQARPQGPTPKPSPDPQQKPPTDAVPDPPQQTTPEQPQQTDPEQPAKPGPEDPRPPVDAKKQAAFARAVSDARRSMSERDLDAARRHLQAAALKVQAPAEQARIARLQKMLDYLDEFWHAVRESVSKLEAGQELVLKTTRIAVVEASRSELMVKAAGRLRSWPIEEIPTSVVMAVAAESFPQDPTSKVLIGAFLAVDPDGDRAYARQLWREAARAGMDLQQLMPELDSTPESGGS